MTTPKMLAGMTPNSHAVATFAFSPALLGQSPAAFLKNHRSPMPSGNFNSPGMFAALGVTGTPSMQQLPPDENKKRELAEILRVLGTRPGRISVAAVERLAKGMGLECYKDTDPATGGTTLSLAAKIFLLDIEFTGDKVERVQISFENTPGPSSDLAAQAAAIFQKNLTPSSLSPGRPPLLVPSLSDFAENLTRFYRTDKLSGSINCFAAITGIYQSLRKIYEYERDSMDSEMAVMCVGNGRPAMHVRGKVGLSIDYWKERRTSAEQEEGEDGEEKLWRIMIEVEETPPDFENNLNMGNMTITPVRASDQWVSDEVKKSNNLFDEELTTDWLEPPLEELLDVTGDSSASRPSSARFLARLDPPVVVPLQDQMELYTGMQMTGLGTLETLLFPGLPPSNDTYRHIHVPDSTAPLHHYHLHPYLKPVYVRYVSEIPFSHPRDILPILRTLRQYVLVKTLLESCFSPLHPSPPPPSPPHSSIDDLNFFLDSTSPSTGEVPVDITLEPGQQFGIRVVFPERANTGVVNMQVQVGRNAEVSVKQNERAEKAIKACEDLGLVVEWIRRQS
ncbi:mediator of RNA polymerase II transcription subunit 1-domain-containing protein [Tricharina praecox]|uniref:mediator of RNA polymerase II transcription subunit 1-domain-containing protein n=1 Tax=Tricharina praecox TaxID=43433 RepID=UPI0022207C9D|nr:mediator of RNA polymerase II transcription subunit 1-domain-containing protein [Tricharina praecox]KAI5851835.1 mediator of RNA polymerase II transcription subunit 1-domain-containing protein [Tricharina praecox]